MNRILIILSIYFIFVCGSIVNSELIENFPLIKGSMRDVGRGRKTGHYFLYPYHAWHALSWIYWIKVKLIIVAFFVGTAFIWAIQYIGKFYQQCQTVDHIHYGHYRSFYD